MNKPLSTKARQTAPGCFLGVFALFGFAFLFVFLVPIFKVVVARGWNETPCVIQSSAVKSHSGKGTTYSVEITYSYSVDGQRYLGKHYQFMGGSSSGRDGKRAVVARYPAGSRAICYVNPRDPSDAVIERGFTPDLLFVFIPLIFVIIGVSGMVYSRRAAKLPAGARWQPGAMRNAADFSSVSTASLELKPSASPLAKLGVFIGMALFWNGIVSAFVMEAIRGWRNGHAQWGLMIFLVPFVLVGTGLVWGGFYQVLALFNPRLHLKVTPGAVALGDNLTLEWRLDGRANVLTSLQISLEGSEEATCQNGKNTSTATEVFSKVELVNTTRSEEFGMGQARITLPRDVMHSLDTGHNKIAWKIRVKGAIPRWPDLSEDYPLMVLPLRKGTS